MFEFLSLVGPEKAVSAAHMTIRLLEGRRDIFTDGISETLNSEDWSSDETQLAFRALTEIQNTVKMPLRDLPEEVLNKYLLALAQVATDSTGKGLSVLELSRGRKILERWKNEKPANDSQVIEQIPKPVDESSKAKSSAYRSLRRVELDRYRDMSEDELRHEAKRLRESLFRLNFKVALGELDAVKRIRQEKQSLKRIGTIIKRRLAEERSN